jgi:hypothetical protein
MLTERKGWAGTRVLLGIGAVECGGCEMTEIDVKKIPFHAVASNAKTEKDDQGHQSHAQGPNLAGSGGVGWYLPTVNSPHVFESWCPCYSNICEVQSSPCYGDDVCCFL